VAASELATLVPDRALQWGFVGYLMILIAIVIMRSSGHKAQGNRVKAVRRR
jgi:hypothetical protein